MMKADGKKREKFDKAIETLQEYIRNKVVIFNAKTSKYSDSYFLIDLISKDYDLQKYGIPVLKKLFENFDAVFRFVSSLSTKNEYALEIKCSKPLLTSVMQELFRTDEMLKQIFGHNLIIIKQIIYDKLQIPMSIWNYISEDNQYQSLMKDELNNVEYKIIGHKYEDVLTQLLSICFTIKINKSITINSNVSSKKSTERLQLTDSESNEYILSNVIENGNTKVIRIIDPLTNKIIPFTFQTIIELNRLLYYRLLNKMSLLEAKIKNSRDKRYSMGNENDNDNKKTNSLEHQKNILNNCIQTLLSKPIWPFIEVKRSRAGTVERIEPNKIHYVYRGGRTHMMTDSALPMLLKVVDGGDDDRIKNDKCVRLLYYEIDISQVGIDKSICVGTCLGRDFSYFTSSAEPGLRNHSWGLYGDLGILCDCNKYKVPYGPSFQNNLTVGCGFLLDEPEDNEINDDDDDNDRDRDDDKEYDNEFDETKEDIKMDEKDDDDDSDDEEKDRYTSSLFFSYDGLVLKAYPDVDRNDTILPNYILHVCGTLCAMNLCISSHSSTQDCYHIYTCIWRVCWCNMNNSEFFFSCNHQIYRKCMVLLQQDQKIVKLNSTLDQHLNARIQIK